MCDVINVRRIDCNVHFVTRGLDSSEENSARERRNEFPNEITSLQETAGGTVDNSKEMVQKIPDAVSNLSRDFPNNWKNWK